MKYVILDIDTQYDFVSMSGNLYVPGAEELHEQIVRVIAFAASNFVPILSTVDAHTKNSKEFGQYPEHCLIGTKGQKKLLGTNLFSNKLFKHSDSPCPFSMENKQQAIFTKDSIDAFSNIFFGKAIDYFSKREDTAFVLIGVALDICVRCVIDGLKKRNENYIIISDAVASVDQKAGKELLKTNSCTFDVFLNYIWDQK